MSFTYAIPDIFTYLEGEDTCEIHTEKVMVLYLSVLWSFGFKLFSSTYDAGKSRSDVLIKPL